MCIKILIVEDHATILSVYRAFLGSLGNQIKVIGTSKVLEAEQILLDQPDIAAVTVDGQVDDSTTIEATCDFVRRVRTSGFSGPMIAASSGSDACYELLQAGCSHSVNGNKDQVPEMLAKILGL